MSTVLDILLTLLALKSGLTRPQSWPSFGGDGHGLAVSGRRSWLGLRVSSVLMVVVCGLLFGFVVQSVARLVDSVSAYRENAGVLYTFQK